MSMRNGMDTYVFVDCFNPKGILMIRDVILYTICLKGLRLVFFSCHQSWVAYILDICEIAIYIIDVV